MVKRILYIFLIVQGCFCSLYTMDDHPEVPGNSDIVDSGAQRWNKLRDIFAQRNNFSVFVHPVIKQEVDKAFQSCNITKPIMVLQDLNSTNSSCYPLLDDRYNPVTALVVGVADKHGGAPLPYIRHTIFHECGHIVAGDLDPNQNLKKSILPAFANLSLSVCAGMRAGKALCNFPLVARVVAGIGTGLSSFYAFRTVYPKTIGAYESRKMERNADMFAAQKLIGLGDYYAPVYKFLNYTYLHDAGHFNMHNEHWFFHDHPEYLERARIILDELKNARVDFAHMPIDKSICIGDNEYPDEQIIENMQQQFIMQVQKYFPKYLSN